MPILTLAHSHPKFAAGPRTCLIITCEICPISGKLAPSLNSHFSLLEPSLQSSLYPQGMAAQRIIQAVVVLYQSTINGSATLQSLQSIFAAQPALQEQISLLVYDNSPEPQPASDLQHLGKADQYFHDSSNGGLATAYGYALGLAVQAGLDWLLLLDQDTTLTAELFAELLSAIAAGPGSEVCAIVPRQVRDGVLLSPRLMRGGRDLPVETGLAKQRLTVFNSAACVRVAALRAIGGFPREFPLDYLDHIVFHRLQAPGGRLLVLPVSIEHQLSVKNLAGEMGLERYKRLLAAEWGFIREVKPKGGAPVQRIRLLQRALSQSRMPNKAYATATLASAFAR